MSIAYKLIEAGKQYNSTQSTSLMKARKQRAQRRKAFAKKQEHKAQKGKPSRREKLGRNRYSNFQLPMQFSTQSTVTVFKSLLAVRRSTTSMMRMLFPR